MPLYMAPALPAYYEPPSVRASGGRLCGPAGVPRALSSSLTRFPRRSDAVVQPHAFQEVVLPPRALVRPAYPGWCQFKTASFRHRTRSLQAYLGPRNIQHTVRYTELSPDRFKDLGGGQADVDGSGCKAENTGTGRFWRTNYENCFSSSAGW